MYALSLSTLLLLLTVNNVASLSLPTHFGSSMVLQRDVNVTLWGVDAPNARITVTFLGANYTSQCDASSGRFAVVLPPSSVRTTPTTIVISSSSGPSLSLSDVVVGDVYVCSGQSNMGLAIANIVEVATVTSQAATYGPLLRLFQVATLDEYTNATTPQVNLSASIPWSRASASSVPGMSAMCYLYGVQAVTALGSVPIGLMANAWGGVAIQVYMSPASLAKCTTAEAPMTHEQRLAAAAALSASRDERTLGVMAAAELAYTRFTLTANPTAPSCLYNSMLYPLLSVRHL